MSSSFQMWSATPAAIAARGDLGCQDVGSVKLTHYPWAKRRLPSGHPGRNESTVARSPSFNPVHGFQPSSLAASVLSRALWCRSPGRGGP